jgi:hypothetical protein
LFSLETLAVVFTLRSQRDPSRVLHLTLQAWYGILDLADLYGWSPFRAFWVGNWQDIEDPLEDGRLVILEDALNLADALEQAFYEYESQRVPASYYLFEPDDEYLRNRPSIGAITAVIDFCRQGAFWVEPYRRPGQVSGGTD